jgi:pimeloyl-ACP methyl ester carboxylesterase
MFPIGLESRASIAKRLVDRSREGIERKLKIVIHAEKLVTRALIDEEWAINNSPGSEEAFRDLAEYFLSSLDEDAVGERLSALPKHFPTLLVWGEEDRSVPVAVGRRAQKILDNVPLKVIPNTAHAPYWEDPESFNRILIEFIAGRP